jgi:hypothetical protein
LSVFGIVDKTLRPPFDIKTRRIYTLLIITLGRQYPGTQHVFKPNCDTKMPKYPILVASYTNDIVTLEFDSESATLKQTSSTTVGHHPSWIEGHLTLPNVVYTGLEQSDGKILALRFEDNGKKGEIVSEISSIGRDPCSVHVDKDQVFAANVCPHFISFKITKRTGISTMI